MSVHAKLQSTVASRRAYLFVIVGFVLFGSKSILIKLVYRYQVDPETLIALRMIVAAPFYIAVSVWTRIHDGRAAKMTNRQWIGVGAAGIVGYYLASLLDLTGLQYVTAGLERLILYTYPLMVVLLSSLLFGRQLRKQEMVAMVAAYTGLVFIIAHDLDPSGSDVIWGSMLVLASAACFAVFVVISGRIIPAIGSKRFTSIAMLVSGIMVGIHFGIASEQSLMSLPTPVYGLALLMGTVCTVIPSYLVAAGIAGIGAERAALMGMIGPASTLVGAYLILGEPIVAQQIAGAIVVVASVAYVARPRSYSAGAAALCHRRGIASPIRPREPPSSFGSR